MDEKKNSLQQRVNIIHTLNLYNLCYTLLLFSIVPSKGWFSLPSETKLLESCIDKKVIMHPRPPGSHIGINN